MRSIMRIPLLLSLLLGACAASPDRLGGPVDTFPPPPLAGAAREFVLAALSEGKGSLPEPTPGEAVAGNGQKLPYDRWLVRGSIGDPDRVRVFDAFVDSLVAKGGHYYALYQRSDGRPGTFIVVADGHRVIVSKQDW